MMRQVRFHSYRKVANPADRRRWATSPPVWTQQWALAGGAVRDPNRAIRASRVHDRCPCHSRFYVPYSVNTTTAEAIALIMTELIHSSACGRSLRPSERMTSGARARDVGIILWEMSLHQADIWKPFYRVTLRSDTPRRILPEISRGGRNLRPSSARGKRAGSPF